MDKYKLKSYYHSLNKKIKGNRFLLKFNIIFTPILKYFYFSNERKMFKGIDFSKSHHKSILFFTSQKCASTFLSNILESLCESEGMVSIRFSNYFKDVDRSSWFSDRLFLNRAFINKGYYYGAFRAFHKIPNIDNYKVILILRDPRDVLTSSYFSTAFNHPITRKDNLINRDKALSQTIDEYVLDNYKQFKNVYEDYINYIMNKPNVLFLKYEDMITDFEPWLKKLVKHVELENHELIINKIITNTSFEVSENPNNFIRNVKSGDHLVKLKSDTIDLLNQEFKHILNSLKY